jgi:hypothetical protein
MVGLLGRVISPSQGRYLHAGQHKHRINTYTDIHTLSRIRTQAPSIRGREDISCLRPLGHCDRLREKKEKKNKTKEEGNTSNEEVRRLPPDCLGRSVLKPKNEFQLSSLLYIQ